MKFCEYQIQVIAQLSLAMEEQLKVISPIGCPACELRNEFEYAWETEIQEDEHEGRIYKLIRKIDTTISAMGKKDYKCFDPNVLNRPRWVEIRRMAKELLKEMELRVSTVQEAVETSKGVWEGGLIKLESQQNGAANVESAAAPST